MWLEKLARIGYAAKGIVYIIIGLLAVQTALTVGAKTNSTDTEGALHTIAQQPFGKFLLAIVAVGLVSYALWRLIQAIKDPDNKGSDAKGLASRAGYLFSGLAYGALAAEAALLVMGSGGSGGGKSKSDWTALVLQQPFGRWLVATAGAITIGIGFYRIYRAYKIKFRKQLDLTALDYSQKKWVIGISRLGIAARGFVFTMIGFFLIQAARRYDPNQARGLDGALQVLAQQPFGKIALGIVALGLVAYGAYMWIQARYRLIANNLS